MKDKPVILIVDDNSQNIELFAAYLVSQGYEIIQATSGEEALKTLSSNKIDLILLDVMMPGIDGFEVTRRVRQDDAQRLLPIILVTALREPEDRVKGIEAGCDDFLSKPVDKMELLARVRSLLKIKDYNDLMINYQILENSFKEVMESKLIKRIEELEHDLKEGKSSFAGDNLPAVHSAWTTIEAPTGLATPLPANKVGCPIAVGRLLPKQVGPGQGR